MDYRTAIKPRGGSAGGHEKLTRAQPDPNKLSSELLDEKRKARGSRSTRQLAMRSEDLVEDVSATLKILVGIDQRVSELPKGRDEEIASQLAVLSDLGLDRALVSKLASDLEVVRALSQAADDKCMLQTGRAKHLAARPPMQLLAVLGARGDLPHEICRTLVNACPSSERAQFAREILEAGTLSQLLFRRCPGEMRRLMIRAHTQAALLGPEHVQRLDELWRNNFENEPFPASRQPQLVEPIPNDESPGAIVDRHVQAAKDRGLVEKELPGPKYEYSFNFNANPMEGFPLDDLVKAFQWMSARDPRAAGLMQLLLAATRDESWSVGEQAGWAVFNCIKSVSDNAANVGAAQLRLYADKALLYVGGAMAREFQATLANAQRGDRAPLLQKVADLANKWISEGAPQAAAAAVFKLMPILHKQQPALLVELLTKLHASLDVIIKKCDVFSVKIVDQMLWDAKLAGLAAPDGRTAPQPLTLSELQDGTRAILVSALESGVMEDGKRSVAQRTCRNMLVHIQARAESIRRAGGAQPEVRKDETAILLAVYDAVSLADPGPESQRRKEAFSSLRDYWGQMQRERQLKNIPGFDSPVLAAAGAFHQLLADADRWLDRGIPLLTQPGCTPSQLVALGECAGIWDPAKLHDAAGLPPKEGEPVLAPAVFCASMALADPSLIARFDDKTRASAAVFIAGRVHIENSNYSEVDAALLALKVWPYPKIELLRRCNFHSMEMMVKLDLSLRKDVFSHAGHGALRVLSIDWIGLLGDLGTPANIEERIAHVSALSIRGRQLTREVRGEKMPDAEVKELAQIVAHVELLKWLIVNDKSDKAIRHKEELQDAKVPWKQMLKDFKEDLDAFQVSSRFSRRKQNVFDEAKTTAVQSLEYRETLFAAYRNMGPLSDVPPEVLDVPFTE